MKVFVLYYNSFEPKADLNNLSVVLEAKEHHGEELLVLGVDEEGRAAMQTYFHGRLESSLYTNEDPIFKDDDTRLAWEERLNASWNYRQEVNKSQFNEELKKHFPDADVEDWFIWR